MRAEKQYISQEYVSRLNNSPFFIVVDYRGLTVVHFNELRKRLEGAGSEIHVVKNSIFRIAAQETGVDDLRSTLHGQLAVLTGNRDISGAAKILKKFHGEFDRPTIKFGYLDKQRLESSDLFALADLPPIEVLRGRILGVIQTPATQLLRMLNAPATQLVRVLQAKLEKEPAQP